MPRRSTRSLAVIESIMRASEQEFERFVTSHIGPLAQRHGASIIREDGPILQSAEFSAGPVCVRFNNDRGLLSLDVSPTHVLRFWAVEEIARLLPPIRLLSGGVQRLSLTEQFELVQAHWPELESMFGVANYRQTAQLLSQTAPTNRPR